MATSLEIRKALETALASALDGHYGAGSSDPTNALCMVQWPNQKLKDLDAKQLYVRPTLHGPDAQPRTLGQTPLVSSKGFFKIGCFLKQGLRQDPLDTLAETVKAAYPYSSDLTAGAGKIQIDHILDGDLLLVSGWAYKPVDIFWSVNI